MAERTRGIPLETHYQSRIQYEGNKSSFSHESKQVSPTLRWAGAPGGSGFMAPAWQLRVSQPMGQAPHFELSMMGGGRRFRTSTAPPSGPYRARAATKVSTGAPYGADAALGRAPQRIQFTALGVRGPWKRSPWNKHQKLAGISKSNTLECCWRRRASPHHPKREL